MTDKNIERLLDRLFGKYGALKKGRNWLFQSAETVCHVKLEAIRWRKHEYDLPFWIFVRELWTGPALAEPIWKAPTWHIMGSRYTPNLQQALELEHCLKLAHPYDSSKPGIERLEELCNEMVVPFLLELRTVDGIRRAYREGLLRGVGLHRDLQAFLAAFVD